MNYYDEILTAAGRPSPAQYGPDDFGRLLDSERPDAVLVTSPDHTHPQYAAQALRAGCDVILEKPVATSADGARLLADAARTSAGTLRVTFNYRYSPRNSVLRRVIADGIIGKVTSVHFEWVLDTVHGADYFRRWHREKTASGGLLVHKSSHHFDLVNWWIGDIPSTVYARGALRFYGAASARERGLEARPERSFGAPGMAADPFALDLAAAPTLRRLYLEAEAEDGYVRDRDVFGPGISIEDNLAVLVSYRSGALLTYSLNAHSPWEGYRVSVNGDAGRAELEVVERGHVRSVADGSVSGRPAVDPMVSARRWPALTRTTCGPSRSGCWSSGTGSRLGRCRYRKPRARTPAGTSRCLIRCSGAKARPTRSASAPTTPMAWPASRSGSRRTSRSRPARPSTSPSSASSSAARPAREPHGGVVE